MIYLQRLNRHMNKLLAWIVFCLISVQTNAQNNYSEVSQKFLICYNKQTPDSLFSLYSPTLKEKLPLNKTKAVLEGLHVEYGDLKSLELLKQDSGFNAYKASFTHQTLTLLLALSEENLIEGYRLVPYKPELFTEQKNEVR
jgi:hypothetical protein